MKTTPLCFIFTGLVSVFPVAMGQEANDAAPKRPGDHWKKVDANGDGLISRDEFAAMPRLSSLPEEKRHGLFDRLDKNGDGSLTRHELKPGNSEGGDRRPGMPRIAELDTNADGAVSFEEFQAGQFSKRLDLEKQQRIFKRLDSNGDGKITPDDKPKMRPRPENGERPRPDDGEGPKPDRPRPRGLIDHLDKNGDGEVSFEEFRSGPRVSQLDEETARKRYRMMDRNGDGKVDRNDIQRRDAPRPEGPRKKPEIE